MRNSSIVRDTDASAVRSVRLCTRGLLTLMLCGISLSGTAGRALEPSTALAAYSHQSWAMENGLPQNTIQTMLQTHDGFLWLGTEAGLVRFDGYSFTVFDHNSTPSLTSGDIRCLYEDQSGALWIGTSDGLARWKNSDLRVFTTQDGLPGNTIVAIQETRQGLHILTSSGGAIQADQRFVIEQNAANILSANGTLLPLRDAGQFQREFSGSRIQTKFTDREGAMWIGTNSGLARWFNGSVQRFPITDPLASASILSLIEDREGNLWIGTESSGLHILRNQRFRTLGAHEGLSSDNTTAVVEDSAGTLWVGTNGGGLNALHAHNAAQAVRKYTVRDGLLSDIILSLAPGANGDLWIGTPDGLNRLHKGRIDAYTSADGVADDFIRSLLVDSDGSLWIGTRRGLTHWTHPASGADGTGGKMETFTHANGLGSDLVGAMARDATGDLWVATLAGLSRIRRSGITNFTTANGLGSNVITALVARSNGTLLIGTQEHGWSQWDGQRFSTFGNNQERSTIHAILDDGRGHLWFATGNGIARCDCGGMAQTMQTAQCDHWMNFGPADGLRSREMATNSHPSAWNSHDGHLWFATPKGLVEVDPAHFLINAIPPPVALEHFTVDDLEVLSTAGTALRIAAGHVHFQFDYAALSFTAPQKVRYRYMLEGFDKSWTEAGMRRTAWYTNIPAGRYRFRVQAANNDGLWNEQGAVLAFELRPHFYQTIWFYGILLTLAIALVALALRLRLRRAESAFAAVLAERSRIAREIHDTLAQGYVGVSVQLEVLAELLRRQKVDAAARQLDVARGYVREGLAEARQSIWALRSQDASETTLPVKLRRLTEAENSATLTATFALFGAYRPLPAETEQEILRIAQEAVHNVKKHAAASTLAVQLEYSPSRAALEIRDDGCGFDLTQPYEPGHFGLTGMQERAAAIGGHLDLSSAANSGSTIRLEVITEATQSRES